MALNRVRKQRDRKITAPALRSGRSTSVHAAQYDGVAVKIELIRYQDEKEC